MFMVVSTVEYKISSNTISVNHLRQAAGGFFEQAKTLSDTERSKFAALMGVGRNAVRKAFPHSLWILLQEEWLISRVRQAMDKVYRSARTRYDFSIANILKIIRIDRDTFKRVAYEEWRARAATLPTGREKVLAELQRRIDENAPAEQLTIKKLFEAASVNPGHGPWITRPLRAALREQSKRQSNQVIVSPAGVDAWVYPGGWVDLESDEWNFKKQIEVIRRKRLRSDIASISWPLLQEYLRAGDIVPGTLRKRYRNFIYAGEVLGTQVPDIRAASLEKVQRAWLASLHEFSGPKIAGARWALTELFIALFKAAKDDQTIERREMLAIAGWLVTKIKLPAGGHNKDFLSRRELDQLGRSALTDIRSGIDFTATEPDLLMMSTCTRATGNAAAVVHLATALMVLLMAFTGLRRQSVTNISVHDWMQISPELYAIAWRHGKKREENVVLVRAWLVRLIELYVHCTEKVRQALGTTRVFLTCDGRGNWNFFQSENSLNGRLRDFAQRHRIIRDSGAPLMLNTTILRRTYATRQLYKGRSLSFIQAQFGHKYRKTTEGYTQFDRYEHPAQVANALDKYGDRVLDLWHAPLILENLDEVARPRLFVHGTTCCHDINSCDHYKQISESFGNDTLPCFVCEHLLTGPEFLTDWQDELARREQRLRHLEADPQLTHLAAKERREFALFKTNFARVSEGL